MLVYVAAFNLFKSFVGMLLSSPTIHRNWSCNSLFTIIIHTHCQERKSEYLLLVLANPNHMDDSSYRNITTI